MSLHSMYILIIVLSSFSNQSLGFDANEQLVSINGTNYWKGETRGYISIISKEGSFGILINDQDILVEPVYDELEFLDEKYILASLNDRYGVITSSGSMLLDLEYDKITKHTASPYFFVENNGEQFMLNESAEFILTYDYLIDEQGATVLIQKRNETLFFDGMKKILINSEFNSFGIESGLILCYQEGGMMILDSDASLLVESKYNKLRVLNENQILFENKGEIGLLDGKGNLVFIMSGTSIEQVHECFLYTEFKENMNCPNMNRSNLPVFNYGLVDRVGQTIIEPTYNQLIPTNGNYFIAVKQIDCSTFKMGIISSNGQIISTLEDKFIRWIGDDQFEISQDGRVKVWDVKTNSNSRKSLQIIDSDQYSIAIDGERVLIINDKGRTVLSERRAEVVRISKNSFLVESRKGLTTYHHFDENGKIKVRGVKSMLPRNRLLLIERADLYGVIDGASGDVILPPAYNDIQQIKNGGGFIVKSARPKGIKTSQFFNKESYWGYADLTGTVLVEPVFELFLDFNEGLAPVKNHFYWGFKNKKGETVVPLKFNEVEPFNNGLSKVRKGNYWGAIDTEGVEVIPIEYTESECKEIVKQLESKH